MKHMAMLGFVILLAIASVSFAQSYYSEAADISLKLEKVKANMKSAISVSQMLDAYDPTASSPTPRLSALLEQVDEISSFMLVNIDYYDSIRPEIFSAISSISENIRSISSRNRVEIMESSITGSVYAFDLDTGERTFVSSLAPSVSDFQDNSKLLIEIHGNGMKRVVVRKEGSAIKDRIYNISAFSSVDLNSHDRIFFTQQPGVYDIEIYTCDIQLESGMFIDDSQDYDLGAYCSGLEAHASLKIDSFSMQASPLISYEIPQRKDVITGAATDSLEICKKANKLICDPAGNTLAVVEVLDSIKMYDSDPFTTYTIDDEGNWNEINIQYPDNSKFLYLESDEIQACQLDDDVRHLAGLKMEILLFERLRDGPYSSIKLFEVDEDWMDEADFDEFGALLDRHESSCTAEDAFKDTRRFLPQGECAAVIRDIADFNIKIIRKRISAAVRQGVVQGKYVPFNMKGFNEDMEFSRAEIFEGRKAFAQSFDTIVENCRERISEIYGNSANRFIMEKKKKAYGDACRLARHIYRPFIPSRDGPAPGTPFFGNEIGICAGITTTINKFFRDAKFVGGDCDYTIDDYRSMIEMPGCFEVRCNNFYHLNTVLNNEIFEVTKDVHEAENNRFASCRNIRISEDQEREYFYMLDRVLEGGTPNIILNSKDLSAAHLVFAHSCNQNAELITFDPNFPGRNTYLKYSKGKFMSSTFDVAFVSLVEDFRSCK